MARFFDYWLKGADNGVMAEPPLTLYRQEYTPPEAFPAHMNGAWHSEAAYPIARTEQRVLYLGRGILDPHPPALSPMPGRGGGASPLLPAWEKGSGDEGEKDTYPHRPTHGTRAALCWGAGAAPNGLARDLRPDEALIPTYTSAPLDAPLDVIGFPEAILYLSSSAPVAHVVVRLTDVAPDGVSAPVSAGILNLTHRAGHDQPQPLVPGEVYEVRVPLKATGYRFLAGHRIRLSIASAYWPAIWPSPYPADNALHRSAATPSRLVLPVVPPSADLPAPPAFKITPAELIAIGGGSDEPAVWRIVEDVLAGSVTVEVYGGDTTLLPDGRALFNAERLLLTAYERDPAHVHFANEVNYRLSEHGYETHIRTTGAIRSTASDFHIDIELLVKLNGNTFFQKSWLESIPRLLL
jgi:hypothetical protein